MSTEDAAHVDPNHAYGAASGDLGETDYELCDAEGYVFSFIP